MDKLWEGDPPQSWHWAKREGLWIWRWCYCSKKKRKEVERKCDEVKRVTYEQNHIIQTFLCSVADGCNFMFKSNSHSNRKFLWIHYPLLCCSLIQPVSDKQARKSLKTKLTAPLLAHQIKDTSLWLLFCTLHWICTVHMAWRSKLWEWKKILHSPSI